MQVSFSEPLVKSTPLSWASNAILKLDCLLSDHAYCERKAAAFALGLLQRYGHFYPEHVELSKLIREEMRHYEMVLKILNAKGMSLLRLPACGYARNLRLIIVEEEPLRHVQLLLVAAIIEARSCERFEVLAKVLDGIDDKLSVFYNKLALAERRHHMLYTNLACQFMNETEVLSELQKIAEIEQSWLEQNPLKYMMHSGVAII